MVNNKRVKLLDALWLMSESGCSVREGIFMSLEYLGLIGSFIVGGKVPLFRKLNKFSGSSIQVSGFTDDAIIFSYSKIDKNGKISNGVTNIVNNEVVEFLKTFYLDESYDGFMLTYLGLFDLSGDDNLIFRKTCGEYIKYVSSPCDSYGTLLCTWILTAIIKREGIEFVSTRFSGSYSFSGMNWVDGSGYMFHVLEDGDDKVITFPLYEALGRIFSGEIMFTKVKDSGRIEPYEFKEHYENFKGYIDSGFDKLLSDISIIDHDATSGVRGHLNIGGDNVSSVSISEDEVSGVVNDSGKILLGGGLISGGPCVVAPIRVEEYIDSSKVLENPDVIDKFSKNSGLEDDRAIKRFKPIEVPRPIEPSPEAIENFKKTIVSGVGKPIDSSELYDKVLSDIKEYEDRNSKIILPSPKSRVFPSDDKFKKEVGKLEGVLPRVDEGGMDKRSALIKYMVERGLLDRLMANSDIYVSMKSNVLVDQCVYPECGIEVINKEYIRFLYMLDGELGSAEWAIVELYDLLESGLFHINKLESVAGQKIYVVDIDR